MGFQRYQEMDISTASPETLVVKLYEGAMRNARHALVCHGEGRIADRGRALSKAMAIVSELASALDMERGGEIASSLDALYAFVNEQLLEANLRGEPRHIDDALRVLGILNEAWVEIARGAEATQARAS